MTERDPGILWNGGAVQVLPSALASAADYEAIEAFHRGLPGFEETALVSCPDIAKELGIGHVLVKDESIRLGLPSFKILGATWAVYNVVAARVGIGIDSSHPDTRALARAAKAADLELITCTDGNWGRSCASVAKQLGIPIRVIVPRTMDRSTQARIASEGAVVEQAPLDYDGAIKMAAAEAEKTSKTLLVQDTAWPGFEDIPRQVVDGYSTLLLETDRQVERTVGRDIDLAIASAGVGSFAQAVTAFYKSPTRASAPPSISRTVAVEPTAAACVQTSLEAGQIVPIQTGETIMDGMNCGTVSSIAWPILKAGLDACVTVTDWQAHCEVLPLQHAGVKAGPCGAAPLAALRQLVREKPDWLTTESVVVLFCTEGDRPYARPCPPD